MDLLPISDKRDVLCRVYQLRQIYLWGRPQLDAPVFLGMHPAVAARIGLLLQVAYAPQDDRLHAAGQLA